MPGRQDRHGTNAFTAAVLLLVMMCVVGAAACGIWHAVTSAGR